MRAIFIILIIILLPTFVFAVDKVDINTASLSQLDELTGIGPTYAQAIIDARPFSSVDDLDRVKGIGPATLQKIKDQGLAYVNGQTQISNNQTISQDNLTTPPTTNSSTKIYINEILPNPAGSDTTDEWIELYNPNSTDIDLSGWQIQDKEGTITTHTITQAKIIANGFLVLKRPETKIMLNNDTDGVNLLTPDQKVVDSVSYTKSPLGQSYSRTSNGWMWSSTLTPGLKNAITGLAVKKKSTSTGSVSGDLSKTKNSVNNNGVELGLANISQSNNPWFLFLTALVGAIILAIVVLIIKLKFYKNHVRT